MVWIQSRQGGWVWCLGFAQPLDKAQLTPDAVFGVSVSIGWGHAHSCMSSTALITAHGCSGGGDRGNSIPGQEKGWEKLNGGYELLPGLQHCISIHPALGSVPPAPASVRALTLVICACFSWVFLQQGVCGSLIKHCCLSRTSTSTTAVFISPFYELAFLKESEIPLFQPF